jgi:hypothetical protein
MRLSINLRGDLAKLSDAELADRLDRAWQLHAAAEAGEPTSFWRRTWRGRSWRGPLRHPWFYRITSILTGRADETEIARLFRVPLATAQDGDPVVDAHMHLCEIRDIMDEMERRLASGRQRQHQSRG